MSNRRRFNLIYKATNTVEDKHYVGQTIFTMSSRKASHKTKALKLGAKSPFYDAIRKFGWDNFEWNIVCYCEDQDELDAKEDEVIVQLGRENCYNSHTGGKNNFKLSEEHRKRRSESMMGDKNPMYGKTLSDEEKTNLMEASMEVCCKPVVKIATGETYESVSECSRQEGVSIGTVSLHCNNKVKTPRYQFFQ